MLTKQKADMAAADAFFNLMENSHFVPSEEHVTKFTKKHAGSIYNDMIHFQQANYAYHHSKNMDEAKGALIAIIKESRVENIRALAAYRLAMLIKDIEPKKALEYTELIQIKSMRNLKALIRAELYQRMGENSKALIEINSILSSVTTRNANSDDDLLMIELANQEKRRLLSQNDRA